MRRGGSDLRGAFGAAACFSTATTFVGVAGFGSARGSGFGLLACFEGFETFAGLALAADFVSADLARAAGLADFEAGAFLVVDFFVAMLTLDSAILAPVGGRKTTAHANPHPNNSRARTPPRTAMLPALGLPRRGVRECSRPKTGRKRILSTPFQVKYLF